MKPFVIRHGGCRDGFCASWVIHHRHLLGADFFDGFYGQAPPIDQARNRDVILVDFSYPRDQLERLLDVCASLLILDHHKSAAEALRGFGNDVVEKFVRVTFDMERSGAGLAWDEYFPGQPRPWLVDYVEDRDLWRKALPSTDAINAYVSILPFDFAAWDVAADRPLGEVETHGEVVLAKTLQYVREVSKNARPVVFEGHMTTLVNAPQVDISELLDYRCTLESKSQDGSPFAMGWWQRGDGIFQYSLRSRGDFDVSALAKKYGGGGHRNAAGFQSSTMLSLAAGTAAPKE